MFPEWPQIVRIDEINLLWYSTRMHFLILKISFPSVCVTAVFEGVPWTDVTVTFSHDL